MRLFISADPGARSVFTGSWLCGLLKNAYYDVGAEIDPQIDINNFTHPTSPSHHGPTPVTKCHDDWQNLQAKSFSGIKIHIEMSGSVEMLAVHGHLFLIKSVYKFIPQFPRNPYSIETVYKIHEAFKNWEHHADQIDHSLYDFVLHFEDTYDLEIMTDLYQKIRKIPPSAQEIDAFKATSQLNRPKLDPNNGCVLAALIHLREKKLGLKEIDRFWSLSEIMMHTPKVDWYQTIEHTIDPANYGRSQFHGQGINDITAKLASL